jgi:hypothetical protein
MAFAQVLQTQSSVGAGLLVLPEAGAPVSFEQIDERSRPLEDGTTAVSVVRSRVYRDSAGRVRIESEMPAGARSSGMVPYVDLLDPVAGFRLLLFPADEVGYRLPMHTSK